MLQWEMNTPWLSEHLIVNGRVLQSMWKVCFKARVTMRGGHFMNVCTSTSYLLSGWISCDLQSDLYVSVSLPGMGMDVTWSVWVAVTSAQINRKIRTYRCSILSSVFRTTPDHFRLVLVVDVDGLAKQNMTGEEPAWSLLHRYSWDSNHFFIFFIFIFSLKIKLKKKNGRKKKCVYIYIMRCLYAGASDKVPCAKFGFLLKSWCGLKLLNLWTCVPFSWCLSPSSLFF